MVNGKKVLVADDDPALRKLVGYIAKSMGYQVNSESADGQHAIQELSRGLFPNGYSLVITDIEMPDGNGVSGGPALYKNIRNLEAQLGRPVEDRLRVIVMSGRDPANFPQIGEMVATDKYATFIQKPFTNTTLKARIEALCSNLK